MACIYKSESNKCYCTTSGNHCKVVDNTACEKCDSQQDTPTIGDKFLFKGIIRKSIGLLPDIPVNKDAIKMLRDALKL